jgi:hypothetical protein
MKPEDVPLALVELMAEHIAEAAGCRDENCSTCRNYARAALAAVAPLIAAAEWEAILDWVENTPSPGEADNTETGHRYAAGYRDASQAARFELQRLTAAIRARGTNG